MKILILILIIFTSEFILAQNQNKNWYFGNGTDGIIFNAQNVPVKVSNKYPGVGFEGMAVASDPCSGELLFYTDGILVINKNHNVMANGTGLFSNYSGSQCVQICKMPGTCDKYYVISNSSWDNTPGSFYYSIVDFSTNPLGAVTIKNQYINGPNYHQAMRIIPKTNSNNYWLIGHLNNTATYHVYEITPAGFIGPVVYNFSNSGRSWTMEYNETTHKLFNMGQDNLKVTLFDFNPATGVLSNEQQLYTGPLDAFIGNFSPDGSKIYAGMGTNVLNLWQYDFVTNVWTNMNTCCWAHDVKTGPDGNTYFIHTFNDPNPLSLMTNANLSTVGNACGYSVITTPGNFNGEVRRFPEFLQVPDPPVANLDTATVQAGNSIVLNPLSNDFDPQGDTLFLTSIVSGPLHGTAIINGNQINYTSNSIGCETDTITYSIIDNTCMCDTAQIIIHINGTGSSQLTSTPSVSCFGSHNGSASAIAIGNPPYQFIWTLPNGSILTSSSITHLAAGNYTLDVIDGNGCTSTHYFHINEPPAVNVSITSTNAGCSGGLGSANAYASGGTGTLSYSWNTIPVQHTSSIINLSPGNYNVTVTDSNGCTNSDSVNITGVTPITFGIHSTPASCLANDGSVSVTHTGGVGGFSYHWTPPNDTTLSTLTGLTTGAYSVIATDLGTGCSQSLSTIVANSAGILATITASHNATCQTGEDGSATVVALGGSPPYFYLWPNGDTTASTNHLAPGTTVVRVEDYNGCPAYASVTIGYDFPAPLVELGPDTMPCIGTPYTMDAGQGFASYLWSDNSANQTLTVSTSGVYSVLVTDSNGCQNFDAINVNFVTCFTHHVYSNSPALNSAVQIYPNPANNELNIYVTHIRNTEITLTLTDILGKQLFFSNEYSGYDYQKKIDLHLLPAGIYLVKVEYNDEIFIRKVVKD